MAYQYFSYRLTQSYCKYSDLKDVGRILAFPIAAPSGRKEKTQMSSAESWACAIHSLMERLSLLMLLIQPKTVHLFRVPKPEAVNTWNDASIDLA